LESTDNYFKAKKYESRMQCRSEAKCRPGPTTKVPPFPPLKSAYKNFKLKKIVFRAY